MRSVVGAVPLVVAIPSAEAARSVVVAASEAAAHLVVAEVSLAVAGMAVHTTVEVTAEASVWNLGTVPPTFTGRMWWSEAAIRMLTNPPLTTRMTIIRTSTEAAYGLAEGMSGTAMAATAEVALSAAVRSTVGVALTTVAEGASRRADSREHRTMATSNND